MTTKSVLTLDPTRDRFYSEARDSDGVVLRNAYLDIATYQDLGEPTTITLTVEAGNTAS